MRTTLDSDVLDAAVRGLAPRRLPPPPALRLQPVHTLVVPAERFRADAVHRAGVAASRVLQGYAPDSVVLARALRLPGHETLPTSPDRVDALLSRLESGGDTSEAARLAHVVYRRVVARLRSVPVQDLRIDLHEGWSRPPDDDEVEATAAAVGAEIARATTEKALPARIGLRLPPVAAPTAERALRALDCAVTMIVDRASTAPPLVVSIPEVASAEAVAAVAGVAAALEQRLRLRKGTLRLELGIASAEGLVEDGRVRVGAWVAAAGGRCVAVRVDMAAVARSLGAVDAAAARSVRDLVRVALAGTGVPVAAGESAPIPEDLGPGRVVPAEEQAERFQAVHAAWRANAEETQRSAADGVFGGWDRDAAQLPARLAAAYAHLRSHLPALALRLAEAFAGARPEDPPERHAEGQRCLDAVLRAVDCGAVDPAEVAHAGLDADDLAVGSFRAAVDRHR